MRTLPSFLLLLLLVATPAFARQDMSADEAAVHQAAMNYISAIYDVKPELIEQSVHPDLAKTGAYQRRGQASITLDPMTYDQLVDLAGSWNVDNRRNITSETPREVVVFDVLDTTASVKVIVQWGVDYMHLVKIDGEWKIMNIMWQLTPR